MHDHATKVAAPEREMIYEKTAPAPLATLMSARSPTAFEAIAAYTGTPLNAVLLRNLGARPASANEYSVREAMYIDELIAEKVAMKMKALMRSGPPDQPACWRAILYGDIPVLELAVRRSGSSEATLIPAKKIMPQ